MDFETVGPIRRPRVRDARRAGTPRRRLRRAYGRGAWRAASAVLSVRLRGGDVHKAAVHWYEAEGIGRRELKLKLPLLD